FPAHVFLGLGVCFEIFLCWGWRLRKVFSNLRVISRLSCAVSARSTVLGLPGPRLIAVTQVFLEGIGHFENTLR
ncbi:hypothetical protein, partial [Bifidobacterium jacchi]|uniref:hypothetical protein n=1 Tax=Bifidobacterium jacchi TaxID=2490545 RepID=UPI0019D5A9D3